MLRVSDVAHDCSPAVLSCLRQRWQRSILPQRQFKSGHWLTWVIVAAASGRPSRDDNAARGQRS